MALPMDYRWIVVGNLIIRNRLNSPHYAPTFVINDLIEALTDRIQRSDFHRTYSKTSKLMWVENFAEDSDYYRLLLEVGDKNVSGFAFLDFGTLQTRDIKKRSDEGGHYSAHVLIRKEPDQYGRHLILIEKVPGIHLSSVKDHLTWICKKSMYEKITQDNQGNNKSFLPVFEIDGYQSRTIREALRTGTLQDIEFIGHEENYEDGIDEDPIIEEFISEAKWKIKKRVTEDQAQSIFDRVGGFLGDFRGGADDTQVFVRIKASNGQIKRTEVHHDDAEILEQAFVQNEIVNDFNPSLTQRYETFREDMVQKMVDVANNLGN